MNEMDEGMLGETLKMYAYSKVSKFLGFGDSYVFDPKGGRGIT
jgi:hypothetical protein